MFQGDGLHKGKYNKETELGRDRKLETSSAWFLNEADKKIQHSLNLTGVSKFRFCFPALVFESISVIKNGMNPFSPIHTHEHKFTDKNINTWTCTHKNKPTLHMYPHLQLHTHIAHNHNPPSHPPPPIIRQTLISWKILFFLILKKIYTSNSTNRQTNRHTILPMIHIFWRQTNVLSKHAYLFCPVWKKQAVVIQNHQFDVAKTTVV